MTTPSPSQEALEAAQDNVRCTRDGPCLNSLCGQCIRTAMLLDRFRAAGVERERRRIGACPECGSLDFVIMDDGDAFRTCDACDYRE